MSILFPFAMSRSSQFHVNNMHKLQLEFNSTHRATHICFDYSARRRDPHCLHIKLCVKYVGDLWLVLQCLPVSKYNYDSIYYISALYIFLQRELRENRRIASRCITPAHGIVVAKKMRNERLEENPLGAPYIRYLFENTKYLPLYTEQIFFIHQTAQHSILFYISTP